MTNDIHLVLSCTNRKRAPEPDFPRLRDVSGDVEDRARAWSLAIDAATARVRAEDLYVGEYWRAGLGLAEAAKSKFRVHVWVLSAGLGLVPSSALVCAYSATLTGGHPDSVVQTGADGIPSLIRRRWWSALSTWAGPDNGRPRTLADLANEDRSAAMVVVAGPDYVDAAADDLMCARDALAEPHQMLVLGSSEPRAEITECWVPVPGRLRTVLGGSMASTSPRAARAIIDSLSYGEPMRAERARDVVAALARTAPPLPLFDRKRMGDFEIAAWIADLIAADSTTTKSSALRSFREAGMACEQSRFCRLFDLTSRGAR